MRGLVRILVPMALMLGALGVVATGPAGAARAQSTYAIGDSVLLDAASSLQHDVRGIHVDAVVSRQFSTGAGVLERLRAEHRLSDRVVVFLGTNGWIEQSDFTHMLRALSSCSRVVLVTLWVPTRGWMRANNDLIRTGPRRFKNVVIADWTGIARSHPQWFYSDQIHMPIGGPGAKALAALIARTLAKD